MRQPRYTLTSNHVHARASQLLQDHLRLTDYGRSCPASVLTRLLLAACSWLTSLSEACQRFRRAPSRETARQALRANLSDADELQRRLNGALRDRLPRRLLRRRQVLAADLTLVPYHGQPAPGEQDEVYRGQARDGTTHFHAYASLYVAHQGRRFTLALRRVRRGETLEQVVRDLLRQARAEGVRPRFLLLDRGFFTAGVVRYLQAARCPFILLMPCRGRTPDHPRGVGGTQRHCYRKRSRWDEHSWADKQGRRATVRVCVRVGRRKVRRPGRRARPKGTSRPFAFWGLRPPSYRWVEETYRRRFGIESSYRQLRQAKARTATRSALVRLLWVGLALLLRNVWVWVHEEYLARRRRGGRVPQLERLRFQRLLHWLAEVAEAAFGVQEEVAAEAPVPAG
jgi:putative transposase